MPITQDKLARLTPRNRFTPPVLEHGQPRTIRPREKAAIIVRLLLAEGITLKISGLPDDMQTALAEQIGTMRRVDRATMRAVVEEFMRELDQAGLSFPGGLEGALSIMDGHMSPSATSRLRRMTGRAATGDPWERLTAVPLDLLVEALRDESIEVTAVVLSKLPVPKAAQLLGKLPGERARQAVYAVSLTGNIDPDTVRRIGMSLATQLDAQPLKAFEVGAGERVGAILNIATALTRDAMLKGLQETDAEFAETVRKSIFTFEHVKARLAARDVPKVVRIVDQKALVTALVAAQNNPEQLASADHILTSLSQRMGQTLREEMATRGTIKEKDADEAMGIFVIAIRQLVGSGEIELLTAED